MLRNLNIRTIGLSGTVTIPANRHRGYLMVFMTNGSHGSIDFGGFAIPITEANKYEPRIIPSCAFTVITSGTFVVVSNDVYTQSFLSRYFIPLDPVLNSHYEMAATKAFTGDFEVEAEFSTTMTHYGMIFGNSSGGGYIAVNSQGGIKLQLVASINSTINVIDGKLHKVKVTRVNGVVKLFIDGVLDGTLNDTSTISYNIIGTWDHSSLYFDGIIANVKFTDKSGASDVVTTFKLDNSPAAENYIYSTELLGNNTFANGTTDWASLYSNSSLSIVNNNLVSTAATTANFGVVQQVDNLTIGSTYVFKGQATCSNSSATVKIRISLNASLSAGIYNAQGTGSVTVDYIFVAIATTHWFGTIVQNHAANDTVTIDAGITVKEITNYTEANAASEIEYSQENVFGSNVITNGGFDADSDWDKGVGWTISGGKARANTSNHWVNLKQVDALEVGKSYLGTFTVSDYVQGQVYLASASVTNHILATGNGTFTMTFTATNTGLWLRGLYDFIGSIDNISVKEITNAVTYENIPQSARELYSLEDDTWTSNELVVNGDFATDSNWIKGAAWTILNGKMNSSGSNSNAFSQNGIFEQGRTYIISFEIITRIQGGIRLYYNTPLTGFYTANSVGVHTVTVTVLGTYGALYFFNNLETDLFIGSIDNVSVKEIIEVAS